MTVTLTATMYGRTETTEHDDAREARARISQIASVNGCRIEGDGQQGRYILTDGINDGVEYGTYRVSVTEPAEDTPPAPRVRNLTADESAELINKFHLAFGKTALVDTALRVLVEAGVGVFMVLTDEQEG